MELLSRHHAGNFHTTVLNAKVPTQDDIPQKELNLDLVAVDSHFIFGIKTYNFARFKTAEKEKVRVKKT